MNPIPELVVVLPVRNRSSLLPNALRSVLAQPVRKLRVIVSDNSTTEEHASKIQSCCRAAGDRRLQYIRAPKPLSMAHHWEWALRQAMRLCDAQHFTFVSSRWIVRAKAFARALERVAEHPDAIVTYDDDVVIDSPGRPIQVARKQLSGKLLCVDAAHLLYLCSQSMFPSCLPRMLNSILPRFVIDSVSSRFGSIFGDVAPDHCLAYRCLAIVEKFYHYDEAVLIQYGQDQSTGTGMFKRKPNEAYKDFKDSTDPSRLTWAAPIPEIETNINVVFHEYCLAKRQFNSAKLPELNRERYFQTIANELVYMEDEARKCQIEGILRAHGWQGTIPATAAQEQANCISVAQTVVPFWTRIQALFGRRPSEDDARFQFRTLGDALWFSSQFPKEHIAEAPHLGFLQSDWRLSA